MKRHSFFVGICLIGLFSISCASGISAVKLNIAIDNTPRSEILPLKGSFDNTYLFNLGSRVMEQSGFLNREGPAYGYYTIELDSLSSPAPNDIIFKWINGVTLCGLSLIGFPSELKEYELIARLYIFDSSGTMIKTYNNSDSFMRAVGLYYGRSPNKKASHYYSYLLKDILEQAKTDSGEINYALEKAGIITDETRRPARRSIADFLFQQMMYRLKF